ncbi:hypothetical protein [Qipengyuania atrilutea]|uniref:HTH marR-type domain-containing protein n=1 Tax=Qipengyuania atrilutea TaxID=2744473 RepID=A0A850H5A7_9SPHN|nr:hypothetical protein [Actirhodobacter atriluteus]NVD45846.1 hypothetical protein [Actirhodobacter atriluteus]
MIASAMQTGSAAIRNHARAFAANVSGTPKAGPLPSASVLRRLIGKRKARSDLFGADVFGDPAWDMLLELALSEAEGRRISVSSLCIASGVPVTTALRKIGLLEERGLIVRAADGTDRRRAMLRLTRRSREGIADYFAAPEGSRRDMF